MHNQFITHGFDWNDSGSVKQRIANALLGRLGFSTRLNAPFTTGHRTSVEQRANIYHLVSQVLAYRVDGDLIEVGTFTGQTATLIARIVASEGHGQSVHVYDSFGPTFGDPDPRRTLEQNFREAGLALPGIHVGLFSETMPAQLPEKISFALLDIGLGGGEARAHRHRDELCFVLEHIYPRLSPGGICSLIDYWDPEVHTNEVHENPGVTLACEKFLADKPERISVLYAGFFTQGYFRKQ
jgi:O-methyltransferase